MVFGITRGRKEHTMRKAESKKPKIKHNKDRKVFLLEEGIDQLAAQLVDVAEEMELLARESSTLEDIEGAKALASDVLEKYSTLLKRLGRRKDKLYRSYRMMVTQGTIN